ncbi:DUF6020 family protein [Butyrivibrio sp. XPD2006]|uniref:DUF6020 family protein n=1 Tax=Butyrivibrio sp. XPD2006 TaxID=1280668 RepID=UPI0003B72368|nr:DUF6020 family protein [Butyrivibrio sp. XPD2006]
MKIDNRKVVQGLVALFVVYAINATEVLVIGAESENTILNFVSKLAYSVSTINIVDVMTWIGVYALISVVFKEGKFKLDIAGLVVAIILSFLYMWCFSYKLTQDTLGLFANSYQILLTVLRFTGYTILFYVGYKAFYEGLRNKTLSGNSGNVKLFVISSLLVFAGWMIWIVMAYPGTVAGDGVTQLGQYYFKSVGAHHPPFSTWIMGTSFRIGQAITGDARFGVFFYLLVQAVCGALILGYSISTMYKLGVSKVICYITAVFFGFTPIFGLFAQWYEKDLFYSLFTLLFLTKLVCICFDGEAVTVRDCIVLAVEGLLCVFLRNNGIYAVIPAMILLIFVLKEKLIRMVLAGSTAAIVVISLIVNGPVFRAMGIEPTHVKEALSVPMQQSARYVIEYGGEVTEDEREALELFFDNYEGLPEIYEPFCADDVKNTVYVEKENLPRYFATWFKMGLKHPGVYFDAFMCLNYGYLAPTEQNAEANGDMPNEDRDVVMSQLGDMGIDGTQDFENVQILKNLIFINMVFPILRYLSMPGIYTWLMIAITAMILKHKNRKGYVILIPNVINLLVCLASPLCNGMRYQLPVVLSVPLILAVTSLILTEE